MKVKSFKLNFSHAGKRFEARCDSFQVKGHHKYPMYRIAIDRDKTTEVFIYYEVNEEKRKLFWYPHAGGTQLVATAIAKSLENYLSSTK